LFFIYFAAGLDFASTYECHTFWFVWYF